MPRWVRKAARPPRGLVVERLVATDDEILVFSWSGSGAALPRLSTAEAAVFAMILQGASNAEIASRRKTSVRTVANQVASLLRKTGAQSRFELISRYAGAGDG